MSAQHLTEIKPLQEGPNTLRELEIKVESLVQELALVRTRLDALEGAGVEVSSVAPASARHLIAAPVSADAASADEAQEHEEPAFVLPAWASGFGAVSLLGRTLMVLGGGYLLRALTDSGMIPALAGAAVGLIYAFSWLFVADRAAATARKPSAIFHALAAVLIAYPLLWETTVRFDLLGAWPAALLVVVALSLGLTLARRHELAPVAWLNVLFAVVTSIALLMGTHDIVPFALTMVGIVVAVELLSIAGRWQAIRWVPILGLSTIGLVMTSIATRAAGLPPGYVQFEPIYLVLIGLCMPVVYLASTTIRALQDARRVGWTEGALTALSLLIGLGGALRIIHFLKADPVAVGVVCVLIGAGAYVLALLRYVHRSAERPGEFYYFTSLAAVLALAGLIVLFAGGTLTVALLVLSAVAFVLAQHFDRMTLRHHAAAFLLAGAVSSGLVTAISDGLLHSAGKSWRELSPMCLLSLVVALGGYALFAAWRPSGLRQWHDRIPHALTAAVAGWTIICLASRFASSILADAPGPEADLAVVATVRTAVLAIVAVGMAFIGKHWGRRELVWLVYPVLAAGALKLIVEDFRHGRPTTLFATLALFGGALILVARLVREDRPASQPPTLPS